MFVTTLLAGVLAAPAANAQPFSAAPRRPVSKTTSSNWSGYACQTDFDAPSTGVVTDVKGTWQVPFVSGNSNAWSSAWVGIDGYSSSTVEQIGTDQDTSKKATAYYAWYEMYPGPSVLIQGFSVNPGNLITAEVRYIGSDKYVLSLTNTSTGGSFQTTQTMAADRSSAEWVMEAPSSGSVLPLANFGTIDFSACSATIDGVTGAISTWPNDPMTMVGGNKKRTYTKAAPSALSAAGDAFSVTWSHN